MTTKTKSKAKTAKATPPKTKPAGQPKPKKPTREQQLAEMLRRPEGVTVAQVQKAFDIQPHSARAQISVIGRKLGGTTAERAEKGAPLVYRLP